MPDRFIRTIDGTTGGLLTLVGIYLTGLGVSWLVVPTAGREAGVQWINDHWVIPIDGLTSGHVAWWWLVGGLVTFIGGILSRHHWAERTAIAAAIIAPLLVAALFVGAWVDGSASTGAVSAWSYALPAIIVSWHTSRQRRAAENGELHTGKLPTVTADRG